LVPSSFSEYFVQQYNIAVFADFVGKITTVQLIL
jgi:hypothetical protein